MMFSPTVLNSCWMYHKLQMVARNPFERLVSHMLHQQICHRIEPLNGHRNMLKLMRCFPCIPSAISYSATSYVAHPGWRGRDHWLVQTSTNYWKEARCIREHRIISDLALWRDLICITRVVWSTMLQLSWQSTRPMLSFFSLAMAMDRAWSHQVVLDSSIVWHYQPPRFFILILCSLECLRCIKSLMRAWGINRLAAYAVMRFTDPTTKISIRQFPYIEFNLIFSSFKQQHACDEVWKCEMENVMIWERFWVHHEADRNSLNSCQLISTHYMINIKLIIIIIIITYI